MGTNYYVRTPVLKCPQIIPLTRGVEAIVDSEDYVQISQFKWSVSSHGYAIRSGSRKEGKRLIYMHRALLGAEAEILVDHINGNTLDNRRCNLRLATKSENGRNQRKKIRPTSSKFKGVFRVYRVKNIAWCAQITIHKRKRKHLGIFLTETEAAIAYDKAAIQFYGEFAQLNFNGSREFS